MNKINKHNYYEVYEVNSKDECETIEEFTTFRDAKAFALKIARDCERLEIAHWVFEKKYDDMNCVATHVVK